MPIHKTFVDSVNSLLVSPSNIIIFSHANPDGDAIGSSLALCRYLNLLGHKARVIVPNEFPDFLKWMPGASEILIFKNNQAKCREAMSEAGLFFCLDFNVPERIENLLSDFQQHTVPRVLIDHHLEPVDFADVTISVPAISSTSELVYHLISLSGNDHLVDCAVAECLYVGIMTDTGSFSYGCNYESIWEVIARLVRAGIDNEGIHRKVYDTYSENRLRLMGYCISKKLVVLREFGVAYITLSKEELRMFDHQIGDTEGLVNIPLTIAGVSVSALFTERKSHIKLSIRSKGKFSVNDFVRKHFSGGGHRNAAGANICTSLREAETQFTSLLPLYKDEIQNSEEQTQYL